MGAVNLTSSNSRSDALLRGDKVYFSGTPCKRGHMNERSVSGGYCIECQRNGRILWMEKNREAYLARRRQWHKDGPKPESPWRKVEIPQNLIEGAPNYYVAQSRWRFLRNPAKKLHTGIRSRAKKLGLEFDLEISDIIVGKNCPCCGIEYDFAQNKTNYRRQSRSPSVDRIDSNRGYTKDNICVICVRCNAIKMESTAEELRRVADFFDKLAGRN